MSPAEHIAEEEGRKANVKAWRRSREETLHRWVAAHQVETRIAMSYEDGYRQVTEYRIPGTVKWWRDRFIEQFPSEWLIAQLAVGIIAVQPPADDPPMASWSHWGMLPLRKQNPLINLDTVC